MTALPRWLVQEYAARMDMVPVRPGTREADLQAAYL